MNKVVCVNCGGPVEKVNEKDTKTDYYCKNCKAFFAVEHRSEKTSATTTRRNEDDQEKSTNLNENSQESSAQETSKQAKQAMEDTGKAESQRNFILDTLKRSPDISIREIQMITGLQKSSISPRFNELRKQKKVIQSGWKKFSDNEVMIWREATRL